MKPTRIVSIGGYGHSAMVFDEMHTIPQAKLVAYAPALKDENLDVVTKHPFAADAKFYSDYRKMLADVKPDLAVVATRLDRIQPAAVDAAHTGCHLICEKPLAITHPDLKELHQAVTENNVRIIGMLTARSHPAHAAARTAYTRGDIGPAILVNARKSYKWGTRPDWFGDRRLYGGTITWIGIHALDFITFITGTEFNRVAALQSNVAHQERPGCEDNCVLILELSNGGHASVSLDFLRPSAAATHGDDWIRIMGTTGSIEVRDIENACRILNQQAQPIMAPLNQPPKTFATFLHSLSGPTEPAFEFSNAFRLTHACLCARDAADTNSIVNIGTDYCS